MTTRPLCAAFAAVTLLARAAPAGAVVSGTPVEPSTVPWFVQAGNCGGSLIAPDRVMTAAHCVAGYPIDALGGVTSADGTIRRYTGVSLAASMRTAWRPCSPAATGTAAGRSTPARPRSRSCTAS